MELIAEVHCCKVQSIKIRLHNANDIKGLESLRIWRALNLSLKKCPRPPYSTASKVISLRFALKRKLPFAFPYFLPETKHRSGTARSTTLP